MPVSERLAARLECLSHHALLAVTVALCNMDYGHADALLAKFIPLWVSDLLLSADLLYVVFAHVEMKDSAAALVCRAWKSAWDATDATRRGLRHLRVRPSSANIQYVTSLVDGRKTSVCANLLPESSIIKDGDLSFGILEDGHLYVTVKDPTRNVYDYDIVRRYSYSDKYVLTAESNRLGTYYSMALAPDRLFVVDEGSSFSIICFNRTTLSVKFVFAETSCLWAGMDVCGDKLFACSIERNSIHVFALDGQPTNIIQGCDMSFAAPEYILHVDNRLYVVESPGCKPWSGELTDSDATNYPFIDRTPDDFLEMYNKRVFVFTPAGVLLQTYNMPRTLDNGIDFMYATDDELVLQKINTLCFLRGI